MSTSRIIGPVTGGQRGWPFGAAAFDLDELGYVEEEWFLEGEAACFAPAGDLPRSFDGIWEVDLATTVPYRTRMLVRRPIESHRFNGTVIAFWSNVSLGFEIFTGENLELYRGFAFVGVTVQSVAIDGYEAAPERGLRLWDSDRYNDLTIPHDDASYDIFTQAARQIGPNRAHKGADDPMGGLPVSHVVAFGASQSANRLATYINAVQPLHRAFDGFILDVYFGSGAPLNAPTGSGLDAIRSVEDINVRLSRSGPRPGEHLVRSIPEPVFVVNSETESVSYFPVRQTDTSTFRFWELAGHAHGTVPKKEGLASSWERDLGITAHPLAPPSGYNVLSLEPARSAALHHMQRWLHDGTPPPVQPPIEMIRGEVPTVRRDQWGNALGGARMPYFEVPTARHSGFAADGTLSLFGSTVEFPTTTMRSRYPNHAAYMALFEDATTAALNSGILLPDHGANLVRQAESSSIS